MWKIDYKYYIFLATYVHVIMCTMYFTYIDKPAKPLSSTEVKPLKMYVFLYKYLCIRRIEKIDI